MDALETGSRPWHRFYESGVPTSLDFPRFPIYGFLQRTVQRFPSTVALILVSAHPPFDCRLTYARLDDLSDRFAASLVRRGLRKGERVVISLPNLPQYVIAAYGVWKAGGVVVQVNPLYRGNDLAFILKDSGARFAVVFARFFPYVLEVLPHTALEAVIVTRVHDFFPPLFRLLYGLTRAKKEGDVFPHEQKVVPFTSLLRGPRLRRPVEVAQEDLAMLQYTGGTTGLSKGAMLSHRNLVCNLTQARVWVTDLKEGQERILSVVPFFHVYGVTLCMNLAVAVAATNIMILMPGFVARTTAEVAHRYRPTIFPGAPPIYLAINQLKDVQRYDLRSIRNCVSGSSSLPVEVQKRFEELTGARLVEGYGLSEASPLTHANPLAGVRKVGSIGVPVPGTDARIVAPEGGERELKAGEMGELVIRGPQVMMGYWNNPRETAQALRGGWLYTGDIARMDEDGFFFIGDRKKDMVNIGGLKVFPREVEEVLYQHPRVREAAVVGISSRVRGEMLVAHVVPKDGQDARALRRELRDFCAARLAPYKVPRRIEIVQEIPKTVGIPKALRRVIREREQARGDEPGEEEP
ncbi:MAG: long-chain fatty acid--CoA ligase [Armatimonadota bacterium]|nr:long-chain fatty acid--CoA ligase [Armatimonadota bacterium]